LQAQRFTYKRDPRTSSILCVFGELVASRFVSNARMPMKALRETSVVAQRTAANIAKIEINPHSENDQLAAHVTKSVGPYFYLLDFPRFRC
jgi:hypothetical protein